MMSEALKKIGSKLSHSLGGGGQTHFFFHFDGYPKWEKTYFKTHITEPYIFTYIDTQVTQMNENLE